jgi:Tfp pilus assembly PilM family ATPase
MKSNLEVIMAVSVYFSYENIVVVSGKASAGEIKVNSITTVPLPAGAFINGMVIDNELVQNYLLVILEETENKTVDISVEDKRGLWKE